MLLLYTFIFFKTREFFLFLDFSFFEEYYLLRTFVLFGGAILDRTVLHVDFNKFFASVE